MIFLKTKRWFLISDALMKLWSYPTIKKNVSQSLTPCRPVMESSKWSVYLFFFCIVQMYRTFVSSQSLTVFMPQIFIHIFIRINSYSLVLYAKWKCFCFIYKSVNVRTECHEYSIKWGATLNNGAQRIACLLNEVNQNK